RRFVSSAAGSSERGRPDAPSGKTPKSERPTWTRSPAVLRTPAAIDSSATISATPIATPADVSAVRALRRIRFRQTSPGQVIAGMKTLWRDRHAFVAMPFATRDSFGATVQPGGKGPKAPGVTWV